MLFQVSRRVCPSLDACSNAAMVFAFDSVPDVFEGVSHGVSPDALKLGSNELRYPDSSLRQLGQLR